MPRIVLLGSTGSIGQTTLKVLERLGPQYEVVGLSAGTRVPALVQQARTWRPRLLAVAATAAADQVRQSLPDIEVAAGSDGLELLATMPEADIVVNGLVGAVWP